MHLSRLKYGSVPGIRATYGCILFINEYISLAVRPSSVDVSPNPLTSPPDAAAIASLSSSVPLLWNTTSSNLKALLAVRVFASVS
jgi:hypothetical protein